MNSQLSYYLVQPRTADLIREAQRQRLSVEPGTGNVDGERRYAASSTASPEPAL